MHTVPNPLSSIVAPLDNQVKKSDSALPYDMHINWLILGPRGSGKTSLMLQSILNRDSPWYEGFDSIHVVSSTCRNDPKWDRLLSSVDEEKRCHATIDNETIDTIMNECQELNDSWKALPKKEQGPKPAHLVVFDDVIHLLPRSNAKNSKANQIFVNNRHSKLTNVILSQKGNGGVSPLIRSNIDLLTVFPFRNEKEITGICDEFNIPRDVYDFACSEPHAFLHVNMLGRPIYFKKFDRIEI